MIFFHECLRIVNAGEKKHLIGAAPFHHLDQMLRITERCQKKKHLIEAAPLGRLDQMLRTTIQGGKVWVGFAPPAKYRGGAPPSPNEKSERYS